MQLVTKGSIFRILVVVALIGGYFLNKAIQKQSAALSGVVTDFKTQEPVDGATIEITCGTGLRKEGERMTTTSAKDGAFSFTTSEMNGCEAFHIEAIKSGYQDAQVLSEKRDESVVVQKKSWPLQLIRDSEVTQAKLDAQLEWAQREDSPGVTLTPKFAYVRLTVAFKKSEGIATTEEEAQWVREEYCRRLKAAWEALDNEQQQEQFRSERAFDADFGDKCQ